MSVPHNPCWTPIKCEVVCEPQHRWKIYSALGSIENISFISFYLLFKVNVQRLMNPINDFNFRRKMLNFTNLSFIKSQMVIKMIEHL